MKSMNFVFPLTIFFLKIDIGICIAEKQAHLGYSTDNDNKLKSFPLTLNTYFQSISDAIFSDNNYQGCFPEDKIKSRYIFEGPIHLVPDFTTR